MSETANLIRCEMELTRLTAEYAELKEVHENTVIGNFLDKDGKWEPMHEHYRQQRAEITRLTAELAKARGAQKQAMTDLGKLLLSTVSIDDHIKLGKELAKAREELNRWKQSAEEVLRVASAKEEQDGKRMENELLADL